MLCRSKIHVLSYFIIYYYNIILILSEINVTAKNTQLGKIAKGGTYE